MKMKKRWEKALQNNYGTPEIALDHGKGVEVWDENGKRYLDFLGGIATNILGHAHPVIIKAVTTQVSQLSHVSNLYSHLPGIELAERLQDLIGDSSARVFFCNSGAEANEAAIKISRLTGKKEIIAAIGGFHGRTFGALSITGQESKRIPFEPLLKKIKFVPFGDLHAMRKAVSKKTAMVILEPIQGENGVVVPQHGYLAGVREICDDHGALFAIDAVQTGMGRTGEWFGYESEEFQPDIVTLAKGLGGGLPLGAMITLGQKVPAFKPGEHGSTFGGNPIACAASNAAIDYLVRKNLLSSIKEHEMHLKTALSVLPGVAEVRGRGLLLGIVLETDIAQKMLPIAVKNGLIMNAPSSHVIRIAPALVVTKRQINEFVQVFSKSLREAQNG
jgi:acetylornithine aminotransferase